VTRAQAGDRKAFDDLVLRYQDRVYNMSHRILGNREDALDISQEVFLTVYRGLQRFEARSRFGTWLYRVTVNRCRDELRRRGSRKHRQPYSLDAAAEDDRALEPRSNDPAPAERAVAAETQRLVEEAISRLPGDAREVLVLRDTEDLSYDEIAEIIEVPVGTVRSRLNRARTLLRERLRPILGGEA
jgi:RNA polymerase sigma-70 factor (ECF subfamily)